MRIAIHEPCRSFVNHMVYAGTFGGPPGTPEERDACRASGVNDIDVELIDMQVEMINWDACRDYSKCDEKRWVSLEKGTMYTIVMTKFLAESYKDVLLDLDVTLGISADALCEYVAANSPLQVESWTTYRDRNVLYETPEDGWSAGHRVPSVSMSSSRIRYAPTCPDGKYLPSRAKKCLPCPAGTRSTTDIARDTCIKCALGRYGNTSGRKVCSPCQVGSTSSEDRLSCTPCPAGTSTLNVAASETCIPCSPGFFSLSGASSCQLCPRGKFAEIARMSFCRRCPQDTLTTATPSAQSIAECVCKGEDDGHPGYFHECEGMMCGLNRDAKFIAAFCKECPAGMRCVGPPQSPLAMVHVTSDGGRHRRPKVPEKFMAVGQKTYLCAGEGTVCPGAFMDAPDDEMCAGGQTGVACSLCGSGQELRGGRCVECSGSSRLGVIVFFLLVAVVSVVLAWKSFPMEKGSEYTHKSVVKQISGAVMGVCILRALNVIQTCWIASQLAVGIPQHSLLKDALGYGGTIFDLSAFSLGCLHFGSPKSFAVYYAVVLNALPAVLLAFGGMLALLATCWPQRHEKSRYWPAVMETCSMVLGVFTSFFLMISDFAVNRGLAVTTHPGGHQTLRAFPFLHVEDPEAQAIKIVCISGVVLWCAGGTAFVMMILIKLKGVMGTDLRFRRATMSLTVPFRAGCPWWGVVVLFQNFSVAITLCLFEDGVSQTFYMSAVIFLYAMMLAAVQPYYAPFSYYCDFATSTCTGIVVMACQLARSYEVLVFTIVIVTYTSAAFFFGVAFYDRIRFKITGKPTDWRVYGDATIGKLNEVLPHTIDLTLVAMHHSEKNGYDFKFYAEIQRRSSWTTNTEQEDKAHASVDVSANVVRSQKEQSSQTDAREKGTAPNSDKRCL